jgi:3-hydroxybutyryl-CoA dehydrogenase
MRQFETAAVVGTGMMGPGIAVTLALGGVRPVLVSRTRDGAEQGVASVHRLLMLLGDNGLADRISAAAIDVSTDFEQAIRAADIVVESAPENMALKQNLFRQMDAIAKRDAVLASNTSSMSITEIASLCEHPERILTTHFWNPPHLMRLVEIVKGDRTTDEAALAVRDLLARCGKLPVIVNKDTPGQLGNRLQFALLREAMHIVEQGIADAEAVDIVAMNGFGLRMPVYGPFEHQDIVGLTTCKAIMDYVAPNLNSVPRAPAIVDRLLSEGGTFLDWSTRDREQTKARRDAWVLEMAKRSRAADVQPPARKPVDLPANSALIVIDMQRAIDHPSWGQRNNPDAERIIASLLDVWRQRGLLVWHVRHDSREPDSTYRPGQPLHEFKRETAPVGGERVVPKQTPSAFVGTPLEQELRAAGCDAVVIAGVITNNSVEATARHAGNLGFATYVVEDGCFTFGKRDWQGRWRSADEVHALSLANLEGEYCTVARAADVLAAINSVPQQRSATP